MLKRLGLYGSAAGLLCGLLAAPAHAYALRAPLACAVKNGVLLTNYSNYLIPNWATLDVDVTSGKYKQHFSRQLTAPLPIGVTINYGPVLLVTQTGAPSTCVASAIWRIPFFGRR